MNLKLFRQQCLLTDKKTSAKLFNTWQKININNYQLFVHPDLEIH